MLINERIKDLRATSGMTLKEVADRIGVSEATAHRYETGEIKVVPYSSIEGLANLYGCDPGYITGWQAEYSRDDIKTLEKLSAEDNELIKAYHSAPEDKKLAIRVLLGLE